MNFNKSKLNKFVLYVSSITIALFGILYSFGEVKAEIDFTEADVVAYYPLNETCNDYFDNYNLSLHDAGGSYSISWVDTFFGNGINVKGSATSNTTGSSYCYSNDIDYIFPSADGDEFSISFWFKAGTTPDLIRLFSYGTRVYSTSGNFGELNFDINSNGEGHFVFNTSDDYTNVHMFLPSGTFKYDNTIYHVVIVGQWGSNMTSKFKIYVNGSVASHSVTGIATALPRINQKYTYNGLSIGANSYYQYAPYGQFGHNGDMGEFAIFNRILTSDEVALLGEKSLSEILNASGGGGFSSNSRIYWMGVGSHYNHSYESWSIPIYYDFCDVYKDVEYVDIAFCYGPTFDEYSECYTESTPYKVIKDIHSGVNPSPCSGVVDVSGVVHEGSLYSGYLYPILTLSGEEYGSEEVVGGRFDYLFPEYKNTTNNYITPLIINNVYSVPLNSTSSSIVFKYNLPDFDYTSSTSEICLYNMESSSKTDFCVNTESSFSTTTSILLGSVSTNFDQYFQLVYYQSDVKLLSSDTFRIVWGVGRDNVFALIEDSENTATSSLSSKLLKPIFSALSSFVYNVAGKVFPFNVITFINSSWEDSANNQSSFSIFRMMNEDNDIIISLPSAWFGEGRTMLLFGPSIVNQSSEMSSLFFDIRQLSKYFLVALFFFALYKQAKSFLRELNE